MDDKNKNRRKLETPTRLGIAPWALAVVLVAAGVLIAGSAFSSGSVPALADHDNIACNDGVPAGWSCVPLVNKPQSGPGVTAPAFGEIIYRYVDSDTMWLSVRPVPPYDTVLAGAQFCLDDDNEPFDLAGGGNNGPNHCTGGSAAAVNISDGTALVPGFEAEPDNDNAGGLNGQYEVRVVTMVEDGVADGLTYFEFNNIDGYSYFAYHVNLTGPGASTASTQAFWQFVASTDTPTPTDTPAPTPTPEESCLIRLPPLPPICI